MKARTLGESWVLIADDRLVVESCERAGKWDPADSIGILEGQTQTHTGVMRVPQGWKQQLQDFHEDGNKCCTSDMGM